VIFINGRTDLAVGLFAGGVDYPELVAWSNLVSVLDKGQYMHGKLARWTSPDQMVVSFQGKTNTGKAGVRYGTSPTKLSNFVPSVMRTYSASDLSPGSPAASQFGWHDPGYFFRSTLSNLPTDCISTVFYQYGDDVVGWSPVLNFTATCGANPQVTANVVMIADKGVSFLDNTSYHWAEPEAWETARGMLRRLNEGSNLVIHTGDIAYATGIEVKWEAFEVEMDPVYQTGAPYMVGMGNHEQDWNGVGGFTYYTSADSGGEMGIPTASRFSVPVADEKNVWYSFDYGPVHIVMWDTEMDNSALTGQYQWLESDLAAVNRTATPWVIVTGHRPIYHGNDRDDHLGQIESLLEKYHVSLSLYGHVHNAQLWCPFVPGSQGAECAKADPNGPYVNVVHSVIGNAGMDLNQFPTLDSRTVYSAAEFGYSTFTATATSLTFRYFTDSTDELHYEFTMTQTYPPTF
jgi:acid phosphatase type 7